VLGLTAGEREAVYEAVVELVRARLEKAQWTCLGFVERLRLEATASERSSRGRGADPLTPGNSGRRQRELVRSSGRPIAQIARELGSPGGP
jgi:hypothetical protein